MTESGTPKPTHKARGTVFIDRERCKGCGYCVEFCPTRALALSSDYNTHGYHPPYLIDEELCSGCDLCGMYCPDFAIFALRFKVESSPAEASAAEVAA